MNSKLLTAIGTREKRSVYVVAEMACSHDGNLDYARRIIDGAANAGADAVQFQVWKAEQIAVPSHPAYSTLKKSNWSPDAREPRSAPASAK